MRLILKDTGLSHAIDRRAVRRAFDRLAADYRQVAAVQSEIGRRMLSRLDLMRVSPAVVLDAGAAAGTEAADLARRFPRARVLALDLSWRLLTQTPRPAGWRRWLAAGAGNYPAPLCGDFEHLPLTDECIDLVVSNVALNWAGELPRAMRELYRVLKPGGLVMLTLLGPDTLREVPETAVSAGRAARLPDMHDVGDLLVASGFSGPVMDQERLLLQYSTAQAYRRDLRYWGAVDVSGQRVRGLSIRGRSRDFPLHTTVEVVYGHAWKPVGSGRADRLADGRSVIRFDRQLRR